MILLGSIYYCFWYFFIVLLFWNLIVNKKWTWNKRELIYPKKWTNTVNVNESWTYLSFTQMRTHSPLVKIYITHNRYLRSGNRIGIYEAEAESEYVKWSRIVIYEAEVESEYDFIDISCCCWCWCCRRITTNVAYFSLFNQISNNIHN